MPFLLSIVLVIVGLIIRSKIPESPVFEEVKARGEIVKNPITQVIREDWRNILRGIGLRIAETAGYAVAITFMLSYLKTEKLADNTLTLVAICIASGIGIFATYNWGKATDRVGRRPIYLFGTIVMVVFAFPMFMLVNTGIAVLIVIAVVIAYAVIQNSLAGAQGSWFPELFNANTRSSGASMAYRGAGGRHHRQPDVRRHGTPHLQRLHEVLHLPEAGAGRHPAGRDADAQGRARAAVGL